jgi:hypothetical protein
MPGKSDSRHHRFDVAKFGVAGRARAHARVARGAAWYTAVTLDFSVVGQPFVWNVNSSGDLVRFTPIGAPPGSAKP